MDVNFVWKNENNVISDDIISVDLLITKARAVFSDPFTACEQNNGNTLVDIHRMREATESNTSLYSFTIHDLPLGVYHYMFMVTTEGKKWLEISLKEKQTVLGSRRRVNYIELDAMSPTSIRSFSDCVPFDDNNDNSPLLSHQRQQQQHQNNLTAQEDDVEKTKKKKRVCCFCG